MAVAIAYPSLALDFDLDGDPPTVGGGSREPAGAPLPIQLALHNLLKPQPTQLYFGVTPQRGLLCLRYGSKQSSSIAVKESCHFLFGETIILWRLMGKGLYDLNPALA